MIDIVFPRNNEDEFIRMASKLGFKALCFAYAKEKDIPDPEKIKANAGKLQIYLALEGEHSRSKETTLLLTKTGDKARHYIEKTRIDLLYGLEDLKSRDFVHQRDSGLDQVLCKLAKQKGKIIAMDFNAVLKAKRASRSIMLGRMMQNVMLCQKYGVRMAIASFAGRPIEMRAPQDLISFGIMIGMRPEKANKAMSEILEQIKLNIRKRTGKHIAEGIERID